MGGGGSVMGVAAAVKSASEAELKAALSGIDEDGFKKIRAALEANAAPTSAPAADGPVEVSGTAKGCEAAVEARQLEGFNSRMPGPGGGEGGGYVILGPPEKWSSPPLRISVLEQTVDVVKETYDFVARGIQLADGSHNATVSLEDGSEERVVVAMMTVC
eukprot:CAMPEP_0117550426 /NCGR_PEP_ID=MMETSP0784-20121206/48675_1 /TAXON_ID=39447 /ORGANISM="" /LENGTH=159 /DNA_ID=CAMNT_0005347445 /DNA_START=27 /DNA_END=506 /DNA_ORIENTATION=+